MADFNPDAYLAEKTKPFDPDAYLAEKAPSATAPPQRTFLGAIGEGLGNAEDTIYNSVNKGGAVYNAAENIMNFQNNPEPYLNAAGEKIKNAAVGVGNFATNPVPYLKAAGGAVADVASGTADYAKKQLVADFAKQHPGVWGLTTNNAPAPQSTLKQDVYGQIAEHPFITAATVADPLLRAAKVAKIAGAKVMSAPGKYILAGEKAAEPVLKSTATTLGPEAYSTAMQTVTAQSQKAQDVSDLLAEAEKAKATAIAEKAKAEETVANAPNALLEAGQESTGVAPPLARPSMLARISAGKAAAVPLFEASFDAKSTAPLKDQYENAFNIASRNVKDAQQELADAETSHTQLLAKANDQTSVYGVNPGQIRQSEKAIEDASKKALAASEEADRVKTDLRTVQGDILENKQGAVYTPRISILLQNPKVKAGISRGVRILQNEADAKGEIPNLKDLAIKIDRQGKPILDANGDVQPIGVPNTRTLHIAKRGLDAFVNSKKDEYGRIIYDADGEIRSVQDMSKTLSGEMRGVNPAYDKAMAESEKYLRTRSGFIKGAKYIFDDKLPESDFKDILSKMSEEERDAAIESVSNFTQDVTRKATPEAGTKVPLGSTSKRSEAKLAMLIGDKGAETYMGALRAASPAGKAATMAAAGENVQAAANTAKGLRKDVAASQQDLATAVKQGNEMKKRQVFYDTASLEDIGPRAKKDLASDMDAGRITHDQYETGIRAIEAAEKNFGKTQKYRNAVKTLGSLAAKGAGLATGLKIGGIAGHLVE
jgi:hypothetical protein